MAPRTLSRRDFVLGSVAAGLAVPLGAGCRTGAAPPPDPRSPFRHGVASGDPLADRVVLWTRVTPERPGSVAVDWVVARDPDLRDMVAGGRVHTDEHRDHTVKIDPPGLEPATPYYYAFSTAGHYSPMGRTRTLPVGATERVRLAFASCSNIAFGYFNAYALIARRDDLDAVLHLGDYIYEYANGTYGDGTPFGRVPQPDREIVSLADYRTRYAQYRSDPDLQAAHGRHPFITVWDDHESANNAWRDGAQNHDPGEGDWQIRKRAAIRAYFEWMPIREIPGGPAGRIYRSFAFGDLADLVMLDTRLIGRDREAGDRADVATIADPSRTLLGAAQEAWLADELAASQARGAGWRVLGQQVVFANQRRADGTIRNTDAWDGYAAAQDRLRDRLAADAIRDLVVLTGDVHSSWAMDLFEDPFRAGSRRVGVEFVTPGISSPGIPELDRARTYAAEIREHNPHVRFVDLFHRGYTVLDLDRERARSTWYHVPTVTERVLEERAAASFATAAGASRLEEVALQEAG